MLLVAGVADLANDETHGPVSRELGGSLQESSTVDLPSSMVSFSVLFSYAFAFTVVAQLKSITIVVCRSQGGI
jgi:hypothetical protein